jgi:hypothetical protein
MCIRHAIVLAALIGSVSGAGAQQFHIADVPSARNVNAAQLKPATVAFSDKPGGDAADPNLDLIHFDDWATKHPIEKKYLALFPSYTEPLIGKVEAGKADTGSAKTEVQKLYVYVAQARFVVDRAPGAIDLSRYVTLDFLSRIDPAIKHKLITPADVVPFTDEASAGNQNPDRKWCTGRQTLICLQSTYALEGKIPLGILLVNKLRETAKKVSDHIDFQSEFAQLTPADLDQPGLQQLTMLDTPISGTIEQNLFYVNQIMKFGKFLAVFQTHPTDPGKTVVTAFMTLAIDASVFDKKKDYENVPVLRNLVPAEVLMGKSSFNAGNSISAGLPQYARNEITTVAGILEGTAPK